MGIDVYIDPILKPIVPKYLDNQRKDLATASQAVDSNDMETARIIGHRLKGSGASYGFHELGLIGGKMEQAALDNDLDTIREMIIKAQDYLQSANIIYKKVDR